MAIQSTGTEPRQKNNIARPRQNSRHFAEDSFKFIFLDENCCILIQILLKFVPKGPFNSKPTSVHQMARRRAGDKLLFKTMFIYFTAAYKRHSATMSWQCA